MRKWPLIGVVLAVLWLFVSGVAIPYGEPAVAVTNVAGAFLVGLAVGMPIAYVTRRMYADEFVVTRSARTVPAASKYLVLFLWELLTANVDVAYRVLAPSMPIDPDVVEVPLRVQTDSAVTTIANSITLTPGTLTMDYDEETNTLYVHAITGKDDYYSVVDPIRAWENLALVVFDEELGPDDPVPGQEPPEPEVQSSGGDSGGD